MAAPYALGLPAPVAAIELHGERRPAGIGIAHLNDFVGVAKLSRDRGRVQRESATPRRPSAKRFLGRGREWTVLVSLEMPGHPRT